MIYTVRVSSFESCNLCCWTRVAGVHGGTTAVNCSSSTRRSFRDNSWMMIPAHMCATVASKRRHETCMCATTLRRTYNSTMIHVRNGFARTIGSQYRFPLALPSKSPNHAYSVFVPTNRDHTYACHIFTSWRPHVDFLQIMRRAILCVLFAPQATKRVRFVVRIVLLLLLTERVVQLVLMEGGNRGLH